MISSDSNQAKDLIARYDELKSARSSMDKLYTTVEELLFPYNLEGTPERKMWDSTAVSACTKLASLLHNLITPFGQRWHRLLFKKKPGRDEQLPERKQKEIDDWCDEVTSELFLRREKHSSGFNLCFKEFYLQVVRFGTGCFYVDAKRDRRGNGSGISYGSVPIQDIYLQADHANVIDTVYRKYTLTAPNIASKLGEDKLSDKMRADMSKDPLKLYEFIHAVYPKPLKDGEAGTMPAYHSKHICVEEERMMQEEFYRVMPYIIGRYETQANSVYGISPAMQALASIRRVNELSNFVSDHVERCFNPPALASAEQQRHVPVSNKSKAVNYGWVTKDGRPLIHYIPQHGYEQAHAEMQRVERQIREIFFLDLFQILEERASRSATASMEKTREKGAFMSSLIGCLQSEVISAMVKRELDILDDQNLLPSHPRDMGITSHAILDIVCTSPLYRYQQADGVEGKINGARYLMETSNITGDPLYGAMVKPETHLEIAEKLGGESSDFRTMEEARDIVKEMNAERDKQNRLPSPDKELDARSKIAVGVLNNAGGQQ